MKIVNSDPVLHKQWIQFRKQAHQIALVSTVILVMNKELVLTGYTKDQIFEIKQTAISIVKRFVSNGITMSKRNRMKILNQKYKLLDD